MRKRALRLLLLGPKGHCWRPPQQHSLPEATGGVASTPHGHSRPPTYRPTYRLLRGEGASEHLPEPHAPSSNSLSPSTVPTANTPRSHSSGLNDSPRPLPAPPASRKLQSAAAATPAANSLPIAQPVLGLQQHLPGARTPAPSHHHGVFVSPPPVTYLTMRRTFPASGTGAALHSSACCAAANTSASRTSTDGYEQVRAQSRKSVSKSRTGAEGWPVRAPSAASGETAVHLHRDQEGVSTHGNAGYSRSHSWTSKAGTTADHHPTPARPDQQTRVDRGRHPSDLSALSGATSEARSVVRKPPHPPSEIAAAAAEVATHGPSLTAAVTRVSDGQAQREAAGTGRRRHLFSPDLNPKPGNLAKGLERNVGGRDAAGSPEPPLQSPKHASSLPSMLPTLRAAALLNDEARRRAVGNKLADRLHDWRKKLLSKPSAAGTAAPAAAASAPAVSQAGTNQLSAGTAAEVAALCPDLEARKQVVWDVLLPPLVEAAEAAAAAAPVDAALVAAATKTTTGRQAAGGRTAASDSGGVAADATVPGGQGRTLGAGHGLGFSDVFDLISSATLALRAAVACGQADHPLLPALREPLQALLRRALDDQHATSTEAEQPLQLGPQQRQQRALLLVLLQGVDELMPAADARAAVAAVAARSAAGTGYTAAPTTRFEARSGAAFEDALRSLVLSSSAVPPAMEPSFHGPSAHALHAHGQGHPDPAAASRNPIAAAPGPDDAAVAVGAAVTATAAVAAPAFVSSTLRTAATLRAALGTWQGLAESRLRSNGCTASEDQYDTHHAVAAGCHGSAHPDLLEGLATLVGTCRRRLLPEERGPAAPTTTATGTTLGAAAALQAAPEQQAVAVRLVQKKAMAMAAEKEERSQDVPPWRSRPRLYRHAGLAEAVWAALQPTTELAKQLGRESSWPSGASRSGSSPGNVGDCIGSSAGDSQLPPWPLLGDVPLSSASQSGILPPMFEAGEAIIGGDGDSSTAAAVRPVPKPLLQLLSDLCRLAAASLYGDASGSSSSSIGQVSSSGPDEAGRLLALLDAHHVLRQQLRGQLVAAGKGGERQSTALEDAASSSYGHGTCSKGVAQSGFEGEAAFISPGLESFRSRGALDSNTRGSSSNAGVGAGGLEVGALDRVVLASTQAYVRAWLGDAARGAERFDGHAIAAKQPQAPEPNDQSPGSIRNTADPAATASSPAPVALSNGDAAALSLPASVQLTRALARNGCRDWHLFWRLLRYQASSPASAQEASLSPSFSPASASPVAPLPAGTVCSNNGAHRMPCATAEAAHPSPSSALSATAVAVGDQVCRLQLRLHAAAAVAAALAGSGEEALRRRCWPRTAVKLAGALSDVLADAAPATGLAPEAEAATLAVAETTERLLLMHAVDALPAADLEFVASWTRSAAAVAAAHSLASVQHAAAARSGLRPASTLLPDASSPAAAAASLDEGLIVMPSDEAFVGRGGAGIADDEELPAATHELLLRASMQLLQADHSSPSAHPSSKRVAAATAATMTNSGDNRSAAQPPASTPSPSKEAGMASVGSSGGRAWYLELLAVCTAAPVGWVPPAAVDSCLAAFVGSTAAANAAGAGPTAGHAVAWNTRVFGADGHGSSYGVLGSEAVTMLRSLAALRYIPDARLLLPVLDAVTEAAAVTTAAPERTVPEPTLLRALVGPRGLLRPPPQQQRPPLSLCALVSATTAAAELAAAANAEKEGLAWDAAATLRFAAVRLRSATESALLSSGDSMPTSQPLERPSSLPSLPSLASLCSSLAFLELLEPPLLAAMAQHLKERQLLPLDPSLSNLGSETTQHTAPMTSSEAAAACRLLRLAAASEPIGEAATAAAAGRARRAAFYHAITESSSGVSSGGDSTPVSSYSSAADTVRTQAAALNGKNDTAQQEQEQQQQQLSSEGGIVKEAAVVASLAPLLVPLVVRHSSEMPLEVLVQLLRDVQDLANASAGASAFANISAFANLGGAGPAHDGIAGGSSGGYAADGAAAEARKPPTESGWRTEAPEAAGAAPAWLEALRTTVAHRVLEEGVDSLSLRLLAALALCLPPPEQTLAQELKPPSTLAATEPTSLAAATMPSRSPTPPPAPQPPVRRRSWFWWSSPSPTPLPATAPEEEPALAGFDAAAVPGAVAGGHGPAFTASHPDTIPTTPTACAPSITPATTLAPSEAAAEDEQQQRQQPSQQLAERVLEALSDRLLHQGEAHVLHIDDATAVLLDLATAGMLHTQPALAATLLDGIAFRLADDAGGVALTRVTAALAAGGADPWVAHYLSRGLLDELSVAVQRRLRFQHDSEVGYISTPQLLAMAQRVHDVLLAAEAPATAAASAASGGGGGDSGSRRVAYALPTPAGMGIAGGVGGGGHAPGCLGLMRVLGRALGSRCEELTAAEVVGVAQVYGIPHLREAYLLQRLVEAAVAAEGRYTSEQLLDLAQAVYGAGMRDKALFAPLVRELRARAEQRPGSVAARTLQSASSLLRALRLHADAAALEQAFVQAVRSSTTSGAPNGGGK